jgi:glycosyltransferase involved in cell wall biosynthesis
MEHLESQKTTYLNEEISNMSNIVLSICIPTYNRSRLLSECIKQIILCPSQEIEIVISDDGSTDGTKEVVKKIGDSRIKYYRNDKNLGYPANILKLVERAAGDFLLFISDEDRVAVKEIPWILKTIKRNKNISQILGTTGDRRPGYKKIYKTYEDKILKAGHHSLTKLFWDHSHGTGIILKKQALNLNQAKKYLKTALAPYMDLILQSQTMIAGDVLCTSRILYYVGEIQLKSRLPLFQGKPYYHPVNRAYQLKERIKLIYDIANKKPTQKALLNKERERAALLLLGTLKTSFGSFIEILPLVLKTKELSKSPLFWIDIPLVFLRRIVRRLLNR